MPVPGPLTAPVAAGLALGQTLLLMLVPGGGQQTARRNAWSGMVADAQRARGRREAADALEVAVAAAEVRGRVARGLPRTGSR